MLWICKAPSSPIQFLFDPIDPRFKPEAGKKCQLNLTIEATALRWRPNEANIGENTVGQFSASDWKDFAKWAGGGDGNHVPKFHLERDGSITFPSSGGADSGSKQSDSGLAGAGDRPTRVASNLRSSSDGGRLQVLILTTAARLASRHHIRNQTERK